MSINLITDPSFENGFVSWTPAVWDGNVNSVSVASSGAHNGNCCIHLSSTQAGQAYIYQLVTLTAGHSYTLSFYAKRTGNIDVWTAYTLDGNHVPLSSQMSKVGSTYSKVAQDFTLPGSGIKNVFVFIIAGSAAGDVWIDDVELVDKTASGGTGTNDSTGSWGTGQVTDGRLYCRKQPSKGDYWGQFPNNSIIPIKEYNSTWYETYWDDDPSKVGYVMKEFIINESWGNSAGGGTGVNTASWNEVLSGTAVYRKESSGSAVCEGVKELQRLLKAIGYGRDNVGDIVVDGNFGSITESAVILFQKECGLDDDGVVGENTATKLEAVQSDTWFTRPEYYPLKAGLMKYSEYPEMSSNEARERSIVVRAISSEHGYASYATTGHQDARIGVAKVLLNRTRRSDVGHANYSDSSFRSIYLCNDYTSQTRDAALYLPRGYSATMQQMHDVATTVVAGEWPSGADKVTQAHIFQKGADAFEPDDANRPGYCRYPETGDRFSFFYISY